MTNLELQPESMPPKLLLFDIDGTILKTGGAGSRAMNRVFQERFGIVNAFVTIHPDGKTDPILFREMLEQADEKPAITDELIASLQLDYQKYFPEAMASSSGAILMPGIRELLARLNDAQGVALGLLTGNFEVTGRLKIGHFDLNRYFPFGAFGSDSPIREELVQPAVERAAHHLGVSLRADRRTVVIGDTPRDVACALAHGVTSVGVATGNYSTQDLANAGAHMVFEDFSDTDKVTSELISL
ncbi:MAG: HAD hydrolase-like protein [bacterium]|nr:HAD hydrolase-like protein [bacterium]